MICFVCKKEIKINILFEGIGKNMYRHKHCYPGLPKNLDGTEMTVREHLESKPKEFQEAVKKEVEKLKQTLKRGRGRPKGSKNKKKEK